MIMGFYVSKAFHEDKRYTMALNDSRPYVRKPKLHDLLASEIQFSRAKRRRQMQLLSRHRFSLTAVRRSTLGLLYVANTNSWA